MKSNRLKQQVEDAKRLLETFDLLFSDEDLSDDDRDLKEILIEGETDAKETLVAIARHIDEIDIQLAGIKERKKELDARKNKLDTQRDKLKFLIESAMQQLEMPSIKLGTASLKIVKGPDKLEVLDEARIPYQYFKKADPNLDKRALLADMKDNEELRKELGDADIVRVVHNSVLRIKT